MHERAATIWNARELILTLALYDIKARYKQSVFGVAWAVIQPLLTMVVFTVIFAGVARVSIAGVPYPLFSFAGLVFWSFFATAVSKGTLSLVANAPLIRKIHLRREIFPIVVLLSAFFDFVVAAAILLGLMLWYAVAPGWSALWVVPILALQGAFAIAVCLFTSMAHARYRDVGNVIGFGVQLWMFVSPVAYPMDLVPERYLWLYRLNPMAGILDSYRRVLLLGTAPDGATLAVSAALVLVALWLGREYFNRHQATIVDVI